MNILFLRNTPDSNFYIDVVPENLEGHNIADYIDPEIAEKLEKLEKEEENSTQSNEIPAKPITEEPVANNTEPATTTETVVTATETTETRSSVTEELAKPTETVVTATENPAVQSVDLTPYLSEIEELKKKIEFVQSQNNNHVTTLQNQINSTKK